MCNSHDWFFSGCFTHVLVIIAFMFWPDLVAEAAEKVNLRFNLSVPYFTLLFAKVC